MTYGLNLAARIGRVLAGFKASVLGFSALCLVTVGLAADPAVKTFDIPAGPAEKALRTFSAQSGVQALFPTGTVKGVATTAVKGEMTAKQALDQMLAGTPLVGVQDESTGSLSIVREDSAAKAAKNDSRVAQDAVKSDHPTRNGRTELDVNGDSVVKLDTFEVFGSKTLNMDICGNSCIHGSRTTRPK